MEVRTSRPEKNYIPMEKGHRAKQFAPFESLGSLDPVMDSVAENRDLHELEHVQNLEDFNFCCAEDWEIEDIRNWRTDLN